PQPARQNPAGDRPPQDDPPRARDRRAEEGREARGRHEVRARRGAKRSPDARRHDRERTMADTKSQTKRTLAKQEARPLLRTVTGVVASDKGDKTIKVVVNYQTKHDKYGKYLKRRTVLHAHDEKNEAKEGDTVEIAESRPLSKTKHHRLIRIV